MKYSLSILSVFFFFSLGCAGGSNSIKLEGVKKPVSLTKSLYGPNMKVLKEKEDIEVVYHFYGEKTFYNMGYSAVSLNDDEEIVKNINKTLDEHKGAGVINFSVEAQGCGTNACFPFIMLPIWPGCVNVQYEGDIVKLK